MTKIKKKPEQVSSGEVKSTELKDVNFYYKKNEYVLENINFKIEKKSRILIQGKSGCGKSTFLDILCGLLPPENGDIYIYTSFDELPPGLEDGKYFFMVKFKNLKSHTKVFFQKKGWCGIRGKYVAPKFRTPSKVEIVGNGVHYYEPKCSIGEEDGEGDEREVITQEQIGIYIKPGENQSINDLIIEEAYIGNIICYLVLIINVIFLLSLGKMIRTKRQKIIYSKII